MQKKKKLRNEYGSIEVEAMVIMPLAILCIFLLLYLSMITLQRALLQSSLESALVYYRTQFTDTFVEVNEKITYDKKSESGKNSSSGSGNAYKMENKALFPYRGIFEKRKVKQPNFEAMFYSVGTFLFTDNITITFDYKNYFIYQEFLATATQKITLPIDFSNLNVGQDYTISATARCVTNDHDSLINDVDYAVDLVNRTKAGDYIKKFGEKAKSAYKSIREFFGAK